MSALSDFLLDAKRAPVTIPGAPLAMYVRELLASDLLAMPQDEQAQLAIIAASLVDEAGEPVLSREQVGRLPREHYQAIIDAVNRLNGWGQQQVDAALGE